MKRPLEINLWERVQPKRSGRAGPVEELVQEAPVEEHKVDQLVLACACASVRVCECAVEAKV